MESVEGLIAWIVGLSLAPLVALFYFARVGIVRLLDPAGPKGRLHPSYVETLGLGGCIVWIGIIAAIYMA